MIANPVVVQKSGGGQVYSITDNYGMNFPSTAEAGEIVYGNSFDTLVSPPTVLANGTTIPHADAKLNGGLFGYFVMPASDVVISLGNGGDVVVIP